MQEKFRRILINIVFWTWCLPQTLLGFALKWVFDAKRNYWHIVWDDFGTVKKLYIYDSDTMPGAISLGKYIILGSAAGSKTIRHEYGHQVQSFILGPLYLLVIGLPSIIWCYIIHPLTKKNYSWFYTEKWADKLGGIKK